MSYKAFDDADLAFLKALCGEERVTARDAIGEDYCHDELGGAFARPDARVQVLAVDEISKVMRYAYKHDIPVTVRGSGTGLVGGAVPLEGGILLDTSGMTNVVELDEKNMTLTVEPGVLLMDVAKYVEERGFFYPPDPGEKTATIGGNISTNAGGMRAVKYGVTRDYVRALTVVLPNGDVVDLGGKIAKNSSGYSLKDLIVGSEGTLGEAGRTGADDGDLGFIDLDALVVGGVRSVGGQVVGGNLLHLVDAVHQHLAGTALADAAVHTALAPREAVAVDGEAGLVQRRCDGVALLRLYDLAFKFKGHFIARRDGEDRVTLNLIHNGKFWLF